jgi:hypothetical protein
MRRQGSAFGTSSSNLTLDSAISRGGNNDISSGVSALEAYDDNARRGRGGAGRGVCV